MNYVDHVLYYAKCLGWFIFPVHTVTNQLCSCGYLDCKSKGKHPATNNGLLDATTNEAQIRTWWAENEYNIGVVMEPSGLLAGDVDLYHKDLEKLVVLQQTLGDLPLTVTQISGSGEGYHLLFKHPGFPVRGVLGGVVIRSRAYIVVAPSRHLSGNNYMWHAGLGPTEIQVAELPEAWKEALRKSANVGQVGVPTEEPEWLAAIPQEQRIAGMLEHFAKEPGEIKGTSIAGTTFNVVRTAIRANAVKDPEVALEAALEWDKKCTPPWGARMARHVWSAYQRATSPEWGNAYRGEEQRLEALGLDSAPVLPAYQPKIPANIEVMSALKSVQQKRTSDAAKIMDKELISQILDKKFLEDNELLATQALLRNCPPGTSDDQLVSLLMGCRLSEERARELVGEARPKPQTSGGSSMMNLLAATTSTIGPGVVSDLPPEDEALKGGLKMGPEGEGLKNSPNNIFEILTGDSVVGGRIRFDALTKQVGITADRFSGVSCNVLATDVMNWLDKKWQLTSNRTQVEDQLLLVARNNEYNPIADYLKSRVWDGVRRIDNWLVDYCGAEDNEFNRRAGSMWLISACARGIVPGSKVDTVLVLEGKQGHGKSACFNVLAGEWFSDSPLVIGNKDSMQMASYRWIIELAELASLRASETESQKAFISARIDNYRPPYGKAPEEFKRFAVFGGTTNDEGDYLPDHTGNRRYLPIGVGKIDIQRLRLDRDQLWAEATYRYMRADLNPGLAHPECPGERWWFETDEEQDMAAKVVDKRRPENTWAGLIREWSRRNSVGQNIRRQWTLAEIAKSALDVEIEKLPRFQKAVSVAIKEAGLLPALGDEGQPMWRLSDSDVPTVKEATTDGLRGSN